MSEILDKRQTFTANMAHLVLFINSRPGFACAGGRLKATRDENAVVGGIPDSLHQLGLAIDLDLYKDGEYQRDSEAHRPFGAFWKSLHTMNRWGGDFRPTPDGNHYSMEHAGVK